MASPPTHLVITHLLVFLAGLLVAARLVPRWSIFAAVRGGRGLPSPGRRSCIPTTAPPPRPSKPDPATSDDRAARLVQALLEPIDNLDRALGVPLKTDDLAALSLQQGLHQVLRQFLSALAIADCTPITVCVGQPFDPAVHEAISLVDGTPPRVVARVCARGYRQGRRLLRAAKVAVTRAAEAP